MKRRRDFRSLRWLTFGTIALFSVPVFSQTDSPQAGVIVVKRDSVNAAFSCIFDYDYSPAMDQEKYWNDYWSGPSSLYTPTAFSITHASDEKIFPAQDSALIRQISATHGDKSRIDELQWSFFVNQIPFFFAWNDTMRLDSAKFEYVISPDGEATCIPVKWEGDTAFTKLSQVAFPYMRTIWNWRPALLEARILHKMEPVPSKVVVRIYAYDEGKSNVYYSPPGK